MLSAVSGFSNAGRFRTAQRLLFVMCVAVCGCAARASYPELGLERALLPGLGGLDEKEIRAALDKPLEVAPPATAALVWLQETSDRYGGQLTEYQRTGVINATLEALRHAPFSDVSSLPTASASLGSGADHDLVLAVRSAAARFQDEVAILMQTGTAEDRGVNAFVIGAIGLVTIPLFPMADLAVASSVELCAVDVRGGVMIACTRGRAEERRNYLFVTQEQGVLQDLQENTVRTAALDAARQLLDAVSKRMAGS